MQAKITLITPPDFFENSNPSILLINPSDADQDAASKWFTENLKTEVNVYYYQGEPEIPWLLHALGVSSNVYFNLDELPDITTVMMGYILGKSNVCYKTDNANINAIATHINNNKIDRIEKFLERALNDQ